MPSSDKNDSILIPKKYLDKLLKLQENQEDEHELLREAINQLNKLTAQLIEVSMSGSTIAASKKYVPFHTGSQDAGQLNDPPTDPDQYPTIVDIYSINGGRTIPHMTLINDGPGDLFFINAYAKGVFNEQEGTLHVNDQRELFNVYEVRLRSNLPLTTFRLIEGIFRTGSFAPNTKANVEIRPTIQPNQILKDFCMAFDNISTSETFQYPITQTIAVDFAPSLVGPPLPRGQTAVYVDSSTGSPMPSTIPPGFQAELFGLFTNFNTDFTARGYLELVPGTDIFVPTVIHSCSPRGLHINNSPNLFFFSSAGLDPQGAPYPGRKFAVAITNDDPFYSMTGSSHFIVIFNRIN